MIHLSVNKTLNTAQGTITMEIDLELPENKVIALYGPSGAGKTTILRMLSGLTAPDAGKISVGSTTWFDSSNKVNLKPQQRSIGFVFQDYSLFPNMSIRQNIAFGMPKGADAEFLNELLEQTDLTALADQRPSQLSGGQQQRVALARALARKPSLLLLDEPLSALDVNMRLHLQREISRVTRLLGNSTILVSHDIGEVYRMADLVVQMEVGGVAKVGTPEEVFATPGTPPALGIRMVAEVLEKNEQSIKLLVNGSIAEVPLNDQTRHLSAGSRVVVDVSVSGNRIEELKIPNL